MSTLKHTNITILDVPSRLLLGLDDVVGLLCEVLDEHLCGYCNGEGCIVGACRDVLIGTNDLLHSCH